MTDHPIIFSARMVRALLDGRKTQTRRLAWRNEGDPDPQATPHPATWQLVKPGDRLWVREAWGRTTNVNDQPSWPGRAHIALDPREVIIFAADGHWQWCDGDGFALARSMWRPSIHMPRWASRLTLHVEAVRVERLHDISEDDARAEGCWTEDAISTAAMREKVPLTAVHPSMVFWQLWDDLHGSGAWKANPEVVVLTFRVAKGNIDHA